MELHPKFVDNYRMQRRSEYDAQGFVLVRGLFSAEEAAALRDHFTAMVERGGDGFADAPGDASATDPLAKYPRLMQPHLRDDRAMNYMLDARIRAVMNDILDTEPLAVQTMVYFKPAGARGQALHQDNRYLTVRPSTCIGAWMALDRCDPENGCLQVVPGSHTLPVLCPIKGDTTVSFTSETVPLPEGASVVDVVMEPGDVLFFHGNLIHGSEPNRSTDRFRRIIVGHYIMGDAVSVSRYYKPVYDFDGRVLEVSHTEDGNPCGVFVPHGSGARVEMSGTVAEALAAH